MKRFMTAFCVIVFLTAAAAAAADTGPADVDAQVAKIQKAYEGIRDLKGSFIQKTIIRDLNKKDAYRGEFLIKRPLRMKWAYSGKASQDITINNDTVLIYRKGDDTAYRAKFDRASFGQTPVALLSGFGDIREEFFVTGGEGRLVLRPKTPMANVLMITVFLSDGPFPIRSFTIQDGRNNTIEIELKDVQLNTGLKDSLFDLSVPKGVNIFEQHS